MDPEEALGGDELEGFVERHDLTAEGSRVAPGLAAPPQHLNPVTLAGWAQPSDRPTGAQAVERVAPAGAHHLDAAALGRPVIRDPVDQYGCYHGVPRGGEPSC